MTGGSGYIGSAVIEALRGAGHHSLALARSQPGADYHGVAESGVRVADIAGAIACRFDAPGLVTVPVEDVVAERGAWAACEAWDQTMATRASVGWVPSHTSILEILAEP